MNSQPQLRQRRHVLDLTVKEWIVVCFKFSIGAALAGGAVFLCYLALLWLLALVGGRI